MPAGGATQWLAIMVGTAAREIVFMCEEIPARQAEDGVELGGSGRGAGGRPTRWWNFARKLPQTTRYAKRHELWRDLAWHETINHARDWLALSMATDEPKAAIKKFLKK